MLRVPEAEILRRLTFENPWWSDLGILDQLLEKMRQRSYLEPFFELMTNRGVRRAVVLMGPRRVGKTVMLRQCIRRLIHEKDVAPERILFVSLENPIYRGIYLSRILESFMEDRGYDRFADFYVVFDEIQYVEEWEAYLKVMVDDYPNIRFVVSGSAAAALRMKSRESGAGRFTDFLLPPLLFAEFLDFIGADANAEINLLNRHFIDYLNFGGFPEAILDPDIRADLPRFIASDILEKALQRDLPSLYGIDNPNELSRFFAALVYNTGQELSIGELSKETNIPKNTLYKFFTFLEAAFLIHRLYRVDEFGRRPKRDTGFKAYITNPCLRTAMYGPVGPDDEIMGAMAETALVAQVVHSSVIDKFFFAKWDKREVDLVAVHGSGDVFLAAEVKWSDRIERDHSGARHLISFAKKHSIARVMMTSRSLTGAFETSSVKVIYVPVAKHCLIAGTVYALSELAEGRHPRRLLPDGLDQE
ncbi:ATP-binding protein [Magnetospirillum sp. 15-1]|uniref:ATP-binding protein n=1 Tax=Magnetospirillum sp. 15-1 TaxID=1979370 RepID=UPI000BBBC323|nr:ATP-binding protein [Magnetospirillum sp. 15-1]